MLTINRNSWHYQLFVFGKQENYFKNADICQYVWGVFRGLLLACLCVFAGVIAGIVFLEPIIVLIGYLINGYINPFFSDSIDVLILGCMVYLILFVLLLIGIVGCVYDDYKHKRGNIEKKETLLSTWYRSVKEKTCFFVKFDGETKDLLKEFKKNG